MPVEPVETVQALFGEYTDSGRILESLSTVAASSSFSGGARPRPAPPVHGLSGRQSMAGRLSLQLASLEKDLIPHSLLLANYH